MNSVALQIPVDHPAFAGHFPGQPLLPGVSLLAEVLEAALCEPAWAAAIGSSPKLGIVKFLAPVRPGAELSLTFELTAAALRFEVHGPDRLAAAGHFERVK